MPPQISKAEILARYIVQALATASAGQPKAWRSILELTDTIAGAQAAVECAAEKGWVLIEDGHSICLTDEGRKMTTS